MSRNVVKVGLVLLLVAALYWPDTVALLRYWLHQDVKARGGILITILSGFLLFHARGRFALQRSGVGAAHRVHH